MKTTDLGHDTTEVKIETNGEFFFYFAEISLFFFLPVKFGMILDHFSSILLMIAIKVKGLHE